MQLALCDAVIREPCHVGLHGAHSENVWYADAVRTAIFLPFRAAHLLRNLAALYNKLAFDPLITARELLTLIALSILE